jgi:hypothetical protein
VENREYYAARNLAGHRMLLGKSDELYVQIPLKLEIS